MLKSSNWQKDCHYHMSTEVHAPRNKIKQKEKKSKQTKHRQNKLTIYIY